MSNSDTPEPHVNLDLGPGWVMDTWENDNGVQRMLRREVRIEGCGFWLEACEVTLDHESGAMLAVCHDMQYAVDLVHDLVEGVPKTFDYLGSTWVAWGYPFQS